MKRKIIRQIEIEYILDIDTDKLSGNRYTECMENSWVKSEINSYFANTHTGKKPTIRNYCLDISNVKPNYVNRDKNLHVYSDIQARISRDITISNVEVKDE